MSGAGSGLLMLDTNVVLQLIRGKATGEALDRAHGLRSSKDKPLLCVVSVGEALSFAEQRGWGQPKLDAMRALLAHFVVVDIRNQMIFDEYAKMDAYLVKSGRRIGDNDVWIAAAAAAAGATLLTTDKDFDALHPTYLSRIYFEPKVV